MPTPVKRQLHVQLLGQFLPDWLVPVVCLYVMLIIVPHDTFNLRGLELTTTLFRPRLHSSFCPTPRTRL